MRALAAHEHPQRVSRLVLLGSSPDHRPYMAATLGRPVPTDGLPGPAPGFLQALLETSVRARGLPPDEAALQGWSVFHGGSHPFPADTVREQARAAMAAGHQPLAAMQHALAVDRAAPRTGWLPQLRVPTLVLHGAEDPCLPLAHGQALARLIPGARLTVLDMGHLLPDALAAPVGAQVADFIRAEAAAYPAPAAAKNAARVRGCRRTSRRRAAASRTPPAARAGRTSGSAGPRPGGGRARPRACRPAGRASGC